MLEELPQICDEFDVEFSIRIMKDSEHTEVRTYGKSTRKIKLIVMFEHYMIDKLPQVSSFFLNNYEQFKNADKMTYKNKEGVITTTKSSVNIRTVIYKLIDMKLRVPMRI